MQISSHKLRFVYRSAGVSIACLMSLSLLIGCAANRVDKAAAKLDKSVLDRSEYFDDDAATVTQKEHERSTGSLWMESYSSNLYSNMYRASRIGDSITVVISEQAVGSRQAKTNTQRKNDSSASIDALGGIMSKLGQMLAGLNPAKLISASTQNKFDGQGKIDSSGSLYANITCRVTQKLKNGDMVIKGEKRVKVYNEEQMLLLEGIIRPYDILPDNTISSNQVADARISFNGFGVIAERQRPGWLARVLDYIWPF